MAGIYSSVKYPELSRSNILNSLRTTSSLFFAIPVNFRLLYLHLLSLTLLLSQLWLFLFHNDYSYFAHIDSALLSFRNLIQLLSDLG